MTYDDWKTETPEDEYARKHPEKYRRGVYTVIVTRLAYQRVEVEVQASSEEDARHDALMLVEKDPDKFNWTLFDDCGYAVDDVEGPPERDPDDARDDR